MENLKFETIFNDITDLLEGKTKSNARWKDFGQKGGVHRTEKDKSKDRTESKKIEKAAQKQDLENLEESKKSKKSKKSKSLKKACWKGYEAIGMKTKNGKKVPNCVPKESTNSFEDCFYEIIEEASKCTGPTKKTSSTSKGKKWMQCVKNPSGKGYKRVHWGQKGVRVTGKSGNTKRKKSFRARHKCSSAKPGTPRYQACKDW
jgi:hypothetical protein